MSKKVKVLGLKNLPAKLPINDSILWYMFLKWSEVPGWLCGIIGFLLVISWVANIYKMFVQEYVEL